MNYTQITPAQRQEMFKAIGISDIDELFTPIPEALRLDRELDLPAPASELELQRELNRLGRQNNGSDTHACFMGGGAYDHFIPTLIDPLISRGEFLTSYTPYQAEALQGTLQAFFEFQTQVALISGMDIANASLYDGATSVAEAVILALNTTGKRRVLIAETLHPHYRQVVETYLDSLPAQVVTIPARNGVTPVDAIRAELKGDEACVVVQSPNFFGLFEDWQGCFEATHTQDRTLAVAVFNPIACGRFRKPGECGADIAVAEGQPLGVPLQFGGPYLGLFAARNDLSRKMPGRLIGETTDREGRRAYCLVLQTREQHIRGAKATSNICTNQGLLAMRATMFMNALGPKGLAEMAEHSFHKAHYLARGLAALPGFALKYPGDFFNEFVLTCPFPASRLIDAARDAGMLLGPALDTARAGKVGSDRDVLIAVTEKRTKRELDALIDLAGALASA